MKIYVFLCCIAGLFLLASCAPFVQKPAPPPDEQLESFVDQSVTSTGCLDAVVAV